MIVTNESKRLLTVHGKGRNQVRFVPGVKVDLSDADSATCKDSPGFKRWVELGMLEVVAEKPSRRRSSAASLSASAGE